MKMEAVDHRARVFLDSREIGQGGGVGQTIEFPLPDGPPGRELRVLLDPAPKEPASSGRSRVRRTTKAAVAYGWDFQPDLIPLGLAGPVSLELRPSIHLSKVRWQARVSKDLHVATWTVEMTVCRTGELKAKLCDPEGHCDPATPFLPTLPVKGVDHRNYLFRDPKTGEECFSIYQHARCTAYTDFGVPCPASEEVLRTIIPGEEVRPPRQ